MISNEMCLYWIDKKNAGTENAKNVIMIVDMVKKEYCYAVSKYSVKQIPQLPVFEVVRKSDIDNFLEQLKRRNFKSVVFANWPFLQQ